MNDDTTQNAAPAVNLAAFRERRLDEIAALKARGINPYPYRFDRSHTLGEIRAAHGSLAAGTETTELVAVCGRIMLKRDQGKLIFITVRDRNDEIQLFVSKSVVGDEAFDLINSFDMGDWVGGRGVVMTTRKGELSVKVSEVQLLAKTLR
ncbi:MAG: lysine--tRNA ligase, partial [Actinobacteria bacterium]|nr:lysine--tRNA ligase [Actinomycetota bacterium]